MKEIFTEIYARDAWNGGSGPGSTPQFCGPLIDFLRNYLLNNRLESLCDLGCGDLQWIPRLVEQTKIRYIGVDCVEHLLASHRKKYPESQYSFVNGDVSSMSMGEIPDASVYFIKDVLQHWPSENILRFLADFFRARPDAHILTVNCNHQSSDVRVLDSQYHFAPINGAHNPLKKFQPQKLLEWGGKSLYRLNPPSATTNNF
ncbi:MAG: class I SAM-dependent methyltransferase [Proteobacteria bacterium]|nr:class I SAM-dependent methyltransferase [Pseudomonadota bacterium]